MDPRSSERAADLMDKVSLAWMLQQSDVCYRLGGEFRSKGMLDASQRFLDQAIAWKAMYLRANEKGWT